ncbi:MULTISPECIES: Cell wall assembly/cell proliferation coordinating protein, KNR4 [Pseudanabaena]|uniref:Cell wall assembly/cell proliferation coordinating protein, KNR4 n=2 Tax=Pseudanabaena TaxID=1152 RepID=L8N2K4_9CYAN|nr:MULTISPECIES: Cell wall assembly/cell proliferation coordinating protein, KNR4 [Pseudanabaena]ELS34457.1 Cell wall assembly/cell proliferation coordinating protein, KNR4 [Pseudanabaena biceps PCC 7429]MDG3493325.1 hypothetical protein [Pseudanabaena catenata USMAC16]
MKSKKMIMNSLKKIEYILEKILKLDRDPRRQSELIAGLPKQEIIDTFANHKLLPPDLLIQIYEKYNGILWLNPFFSFLSLESAFELYNAYRDIKKDCNDFAWESTWFPIFDQNADIQICINLENLSLITVDLECDSTEVIANHYEDYLDALVEVFEMGSYILQPYDSIELDELVWDELREKYKI